MPFRAVAPFLLVVFVAACASAAPAATGTPGGDRTPSGPASSHSVEPGMPSTTADPGGSEPPPVATATPAEASAAPETASPSADPSSDPGIAASCSGSDANREFYANVALAVDWPVLCAVLPGGWFVSTGSYRLAGGGKLEISYRGPNGATISIAQGSFCDRDDGCVQVGTDAGDVPLGPLGGTLVRGDDGSFNVSAGRGTTPSWLLVAHGLDEAATLAVAASLTEVAD